jgi:hypothetical protein
VSPRIPAAWIAIVRDGGGLPQYSSIGGYIVLYVDDCTGDALCAACATRVVRDGGPEADRLIHGPFHEGPSEWCAECNRELESDYGDPFAHDEDDLYYDGDA